MIPKRTPLLLEGDARFRQAERDFKADPHDEAAQDRYFGHMARIHGQNHAQRAREDHELLHSHAGIAPKLKEFAERHTLEHKLSRVGVEQPHLRRDHRYGAAMANAAHEASDAKTDLHGMVHKKLKLGYSEEDRAQMQSRASRLLSRDHFPEGDEGDEHHRSALAALHGMYRDHEAPEDHEVYHHPGQWSDEDADRMAHGFHDSLEHHGHGKTHTHERRDAAKHGIPNFRPRAATLSVVRRKKKS